MTVNQISVFLENRPGKLAEFTEVLSKHNIDMRAMSIAETENFGVLRIIVNDPQKTAEAAQQAGYVVSVTPVLAIEIPDRPGALSKVIRIIGDNQINLEYIYAFLTRKQDSAYIIFKVADPEKAAGVLKENGVALISQDELLQL